MGDGSIHQVLIGYLQVHASLLWLHLLCASFLLASLVFWPLVFCCRRDNFTIID
jgi:hypothetical protein